MNTTRKTVVFSSTFRPDAPLRKRIILNNLKQSNMFPYYNYRIKEDDRFTAADFPSVASELMKIRNGTRFASDECKEDIIISYLKNHSLSRNMINKNTYLSRLMTDRMFITTHIELLFDCCRNNKLFTGDLENYIRQSFFSFHA
jgi:hypothetical protein